MNVVAIINPNAGRGNTRDLIPVLRVQLHAALADLHLPGSPDAASEAAREAVRNRADVILAVGGDGTVNAVINGMHADSMHADRMHADGIHADGIHADDLSAKVRTALALLPFGTANDLAAQHGICGGTLSGGIRRACEAVLAHRSAHVDLIEVNGWRYATDGGIGLCSSVAQTARVLRAQLCCDRRRFLGSSIYSLATLLTLASDPRQNLLLQLAAEGWSIEAEASLLTVCNQRLLGAHFPVAPGARNDDGLFDACLVTGRDGRRGLLRLVGDVLRERHLAQSGTHAWQGRVLHVDADAPVSWLGDGELSAPATRFDVRLLPAALRLIVPASAAHIRCN